MKRIRFISPLFSLLFYLCKIFTASVYSQGYEEENAKVLDQMHTESFKDKVFHRTCLGIIFAQLA
jgi:hypothetical protein